MPSTTSVGPTNNQDINGLLVGVKWSTTNLTYSFPASETFYSVGYGDGEPTNGFAQLNATQQTATRAILQTYSAVSNLTFLEVTESSTVHGDLRLATSSLPETAWGYYPSSAAEGGDAWFGNSSNYNNPVKGNYAYLTFLHELGHALGLKHGQDTSTYGAMTVPHDS